tara:strand:+ start:472 stop:1014 length:543 start_codon:yes stop_codon:yes gene_type:complete
MSNKITSDDRELSSLRDHEVRRDMLAEHMGELAEPRYYSSGTIKVKLENPDAKKPTKATAYDAGWDLYSCEDKFIPARRRVTINTGVCLEIPRDHAGLIWPRSGLAVKSGVDVFAGVVDAGYRGEVKVCLYNSSDQELSIKKGDRIAQILFQEIPRLRLVVSDTLSDTDRGEGGFGSSGR